MGSWGYGPFDDDTAMDFIDDLIDGPMTDVVPTLLRAVERLASPDGAQDYEVSVVGLAAVALLAGFNPDLYGERGEKWAIFRLPPMTPELATLALPAGEAAYGEDAVLTELAAEAGNLAEHLAALEPVRQRLRSAIPPPQHEALF